MDISKYKHVKKIEIRYDDLDTLGHVNNKAYLSYLEEARIDYHKQLFSWKHELEFNAVVAKIEINYRKPLFYGNALKIYTKLSNLGTKSFELESLFTVEDRETGEPVKTADAKVVLVAINPSNGQPIAIPDKEKQILLEFEKQ
jgi:acyl-CoA thioester hydrolase